MIEGLDDNVQSLVDLLSDYKPITRLTPSPLRDLDEISVSYSSEESAEVFTTEATYDSTGVS